MEVIKNFIEYFSIITSAIMLVKITNSQLKIFQQGHYHFSSFKKNFKYYYIYDYTNILYPLIIFIFYLDLWYVQIIYTIYLGILLILKFKRKDIIKLKFTARIKRLYLLILIVNVVFASTLHYLIDLPELMSSFAIVMLVSPFLTLICSGLMHPIELLISKYYQNKAKRKLSRYKTKVIGITGSYGKTSTKNILNALIKDKYITLATEKSYNTLNGVSKNINELLTVDHQYMIVEMGASHVGDIEKLIKLAKPQYGIVTSVGPQHLETFKTVENILNEKMKLIDCLPNDGIGLINGDNKFIKKYKIKSKCKLITFGLNENCDYYAYDINTGIFGINFKVRFNNNLVELHTKLLGNHNIYNILAGFALSIELGVEINDIIYQVSNLENVKNRLSVEEVGNLTIIDDAFNSNFEGFKNALEVLNYYKKYKILITPGIVEAGHEEEKINYQLSDFISKSCDLVILEKTKSSQYIHKGLLDLNYKNVIFVENYKAAINYVKENYDSAVVLIENDVSDIYKI